MDEIMEISEWLNKAKVELGVKEQVYASLLDSKKSIEDRISSIDSRVLVCEEEIATVTEASRSAREKIKSRLESVISSALASILGSSYKLEIELTEDRGKPAAFFYVVSQGQGTEKNELSESRGSGVEDIVSVVARLVFIEIQSCPPNQSFVVYDEPARAVSRENIPFLADIIKSLSLEFNRQIILITHDDDIAAVADKTIKVSMKDGVSVVT